MRKINPIGVLTFCLLIAIGLFYLQKGNRFKRVLASASLSLFKPTAQKDPDDRSLVAGLSEAGIKRFAINPLETRTTLRGGRFLGRVGIDVEKLDPLSPVQLKMMDPETLWLARCIYSETKDPQEQELVAWVVRNRVETAYRGQSTYQSVVLDPQQFSAFNEGMPERQFYSRLTIDSKYPGWLKAIQIADYVRMASPIQRPFPSKTRHFYSEQSMVGPKHPEWARGREAVEPIRAFNLEPERFRFFAGVY